MTQNNSELLMLNKGAYKKKHSSNFSPIVFIEVTLEFYSSAGMVYSDEGKLASFLFPIWRIQTFIFNGFVGRGNGSI